MRSESTFYLNGELHRVAASESALMLSDYLRYKKGLTGTKVVCAEGDCGACTVLRIAPQGKGYLPVNSCIMRVAQLDGSSLISVDALSGKENTLTEVQSALVAAHASQCGFCTPGFVMALTGLAEERITRQDTKAETEKLTKSKVEKLTEPKVEKFTAAEVKNSLTGNLCRCTGYSSIIEAGLKMNLSKHESLQKRFYSPAQGKELKKLSTQALRIEDENFLFFAPTKLKDAATFLAKHKNAKILAAGTDLGVVYNKGRSNYSHFLSLHLLKELYAVKLISKGAKISAGACSTLSELRSALKDKIPEFASFLDRFASPQIKNVATLVGNLANASPIAETPPFLIATNANIEVVGPKGKRSVSIHDFFLGYRKTALKSGDFISSVTFDIPSKKESLRLYKVSQRLDLDISAVNAAFRIEWMDAKKNKIKDLRLAMGGVAAIPLRLLRTEALLKGQSLNEALVKKAVDTLQKEITPLSDLRGSAAFRRLVAQNCFLKFIREEAQL